MRSFERLTLWVFLLCLCLTTTIKAQTCTGDLTFNTQAQLDNYFANNSCTVIDGSLFLLDNTQDYFLNLNALANVEEITGDFYINGTLLTSLGGLSSLNTVGGLFRISGNFFIQNFDSLTNLQNVGGLFIQQNGSIDDLDAFSSLTSAPLGVTISNNSDLNNLDGLQNIQGTVGTLVIADSPDIFNLNDLSGITTVTGTLRIFRNSGLATLNGLSNITNVNGALNITTNATLSSIDGIAGVLPTIGSLTIANNPSLSQCCVIFDMINDPGYVSGPVSISNNSPGCDSPGQVSDCSQPTCVEPIFLTSQTAVDNFTNDYGCVIIDGVLAIDDFNNPDDPITNLDGLSELIEVTDLLQIGTTTNLNDISGLSNLTTIGGLFKVLGNDQLTSLNALTSLQSVGGLSITENDVLENLDILTQITSSSLELIIANNPLLENINGLSNIQGAVNRVAMFNNPLVPSLDPLSGITATTNTNSVLFGISIQLMPLVTNLDGLSNITSTPNEIVIKDNAALTDISGIENILPVISELTIRDNPVLSECCPIFDMINTPGYISGNIFIFNNATGCAQNSEIMACPVPTCTGDIILETQTDVDNFEADNNCIAIDGSLEILGFDPSDPITNLNGLANLETITGNFSIFQTELTNLDGLANLSSVGTGVGIAFNPNLVNIDAIAPALVGAELEAIIIQENPLLSGIEALSGVTGVTNELYLVDLPLVDNIEALGNITSAGNIYVDNLGVTSLEGLNNLTTITDVPGQLGLDGSLVITDNTALTDISALENLATIDGSFILTGNTSLAECCSVYDFINTPGAIGGSTTINGNQTGCDAATEIVECVIPPCTQDINLGSQLDVDDFIATYGCTEITGFLSIVDSDMDNPITNLNGLSTIVSIDGALAIVGTQLTNLDDLTSLTYIGTGLAALNNPNLENFDAASAVLNSEVDILYFDNNPVLSSLDGLSNITAVAEDLVVSNLPLIDNLDGLSNITTGATGTGSIIIQNMPLITNLDAFSGITAISIFEGGLLDGNGSLIIADNPALTDVTGLENIATVEGDFVLANNSTLSTCCSFYDLINTTDAVGGSIGISNNLAGCDAPAEITACSSDIVLEGQDEIDNFSVTYGGITSVDGNLTITDDDSSPITNLDGLSDLENISGDLDIIDNDDLTDISGLSNVTSIGGRLYISGNDSLEDLSGLEALSSIGGDIHIESNLSLSNIDALSMITMVPGYIMIKDNIVLTDVDGLVNITSVGNYLDIQLNEMLSSIEGLSSILTVANDLSLLTNVMLAQCCPIYDLINTSGAVGGTITISGNQTACESEGVITSCDVDMDGFDYSVDCNDNDNTIYPGAPELCDGIDNDCDGIVPANEIDGDADGYSACQGDFNDEDNTVYPGAPELCDGLDNDCDGIVPANEIDGDADGYSVCQGDCDDGDNTIYPGAPELCDGLDNDCDGVIPANEIDGDGDGYSVCQGDCNDEDNTLSPATIEICDGIDNNCDGVIDEGLSCNCDATATNTTYEWIEAVQLESINNTSGNDGGYGDYTALSTGLPVGGSYNITLTPGFSGQSYDEYWTVWIDLNNDNDFDDAGELLLNAVSNTTVNGSLTIPSDAVLGNTTMRIAMNYDQYAASCGEFQFGEVEDYSITIAECVNAGCYCDAGATNTNYEWIETVSLENINNTSGNNGGYADYSAISTDLATGESYPITLTPGFSGQSYNEYWTVWIDFNKDNDFDDAGELVFNANSNNAVNGTIAIPASAPIGSTTMRIAMNYDGNAGTCGTFEYGEVEDYTVNITFCDNVTDGGTIGDDEVIEVDCDGSNVGPAMINNIVAASGGSGSVEYLWMKNTTTATPPSGNGTGWEEISGATAASYDPGSITETTWYVRLAKNTGCVNYDGESNVVEKTLESICAYCDAQGLSTQNEWISRIRLGSIDNNSGDNGGYADFTSQSTNLSPGSSNLIILTPGKTGFFPVYQYWRVWIDWNQDGDFDDAGELEVQTASSYTRYRYFTVPSDALSGETRMRVAMNNDGYADPCETFQYGEVEDYTINVQGSSDLVSQEDNDHAGITERSDDNDTSASLAAIDINVYPNPVSEILNLNLKDFAGQSGTVEIYNAIGQRMESMVLDQSTSTVLQFDVSRYTVGTYTLVLRAKEEVAYRKFIVRTKQ